MDKRRRNPKKDKKIARKKKLRENAGAKSATYKEGKGGLLGSTALRGQKRERVCKRGL